MTKKEQLFLTISLIYIATFFFPFFRAANSIMLGLVAATSIYTSWGTNKISLLRTRPAIAVMLAFAAWLLVSAFSSANQHLAQRALVLRVPLIILPFTIALMNPNRQLWNRFLLGTATITTVAVFCSLVYAITKYYSTGLGFWLYNDSVSYLIGQQSVYTSLFVNFSAFIFLRLLFFSKEKESLRPWFVSALVILYVVSFLLASRNMMVILYTGTLAIGLFVLIRKKQYWQSAALVIAVIAFAIGLASLFPKTVQRFRELSMTSYNYERIAPESHYNTPLDTLQWNGANFRLAAWSLGWQIFKEHPVAGVGLGDKQDLLFERYRQARFQFALSTRKNVHNNYLDILMGTGIIGFLLFITGWLVLPAYELARSRNWLGLVFLCTFAVAMISENYFDRSFGTMLFAFFITLIIGPGSVRRKLP